MVEQRHQQFTTEGTEKIDLKQPLHTGNSKQQRRETGICTESVYFISTQIPLQAARISPQPTPIIHFSRARTTIIAGTEESCARHWQTGGNDETLDSEWSCHESSGQFPLLHGVKTFDETVDFRVASLNLGVPGRIELRLPGSRRPQ